MSFFPPSNSRTPRARVCFSLGAALASLAIFCFCARALAQIEPQGLLIFQEPLTTYAEAFEYRSYTQNNLLYGTLITAAGERKQLKAGGVIAQLPYPSGIFDADFSHTAENTLGRIDSLEGSYPAVRKQLEAVRGKWTRALSVFQQTQHPAASKPGTVVDSEAVKVGDAVLQKARLSSATAEEVTIAHASGITTVPIASLTRPGIVALNRTSASVQLALGISRAASGPATKAAPATDSGLTGRIERIGHGLVAFCAARVAVSEAAFSAWTFFVILPGLILLLLLGLILGRRGSPPAGKG